MSSVVTVEWQFSKREQLIFSLRIKLHTRAAEFQLSIENKNKHSSTQDDKEMFVRRQVALGLGLTEAVDQLDSLLSFWTG
jgi:hypothetical protein